MDINSIRYLEREMVWLRQCIEWRITLCLGRDEGPAEELPAPPPVKQDGTAFSEFIIKHNLSAHERLVMALAMANRIKPNLLNRLADDPVIFRAFKACRSERANSVVPTAETALYIIAGDDDTILRMQCQSIFEAEHLFYKQSVISLSEGGTGDSPFNGPLAISSSFYDLFTRNTYRRPRFSNEFPAHLLTTNLEWDDMLLMPFTQSRLEETKAYLQHFDTLINDWDMGKHSKPGCRILFYGDSGTGKTLAATLLGKHLNRDVYRVDISAVTSKYIGETSKRLESLFNIAESKGWIIFIDEGDALLGQRSAADSSHPNTHYANQDTAFLLQRIENYDGIIIVATNLRNNIDRAFARRFQTMVRFQFPDHNIQYKLWMDNLPGKCPLAPGIDLMSIIQKYPLSPAAIINVIFRVSVLALQKGASTISAEDLMMCIKDEQVKYMGQQQLGM